ncbi:MAG: hypothetical protein K2J70_01620 [Muribaculaceae bacterium]|nr:hypothetical protein [Muribaculaceae bacterium]
MKKCINLLMIVLLAVLAGACGGKNDAVLKAQIESGKKHCPMNLGMAGKLTSMSYDDKTREVEFVITLNKQMTDVNELKADPENAKEMMRLALSKGNMKKLVDMMVDADASLKVTYKNRGSKDDFSIQFPAEEIKNISENPMSEEDTNKLLLSTQLKSEKKKLPYSIDRGLKVTGIEDNGSSLVYVCEVDEDLYDMPDMEKSKAELKENMGKMLKDRSMRQQAEVLASLKKGFEYRYVGKSSGNTVTVAFTPDELADIAATGGHKRR